MTAFGHVSCRVADDRLLITPPMPLGRLTPQVEWTELDVDADELPAGVPREAWIHLAIARRRPDVGAICRAQPPVATALASAGVPIVPLHGQGSFLGPQVPVFDDAVLVRDEARAVELAERLGDAPALLLRGNGAVTVGADIGEAVARMWVLEASAQMNSVAAVRRHAHPAVGRRTGGLAGRLRRDPRPDLGRPAPAPPTPDRTRQPSNGTRKTLHDHTRRHRLRALRRGRPRVRGRLRRRHRRPGAGGAGERHRLPARRPPPPLPGPGRGPVRRARLRVPPRRLRRPDAAQEELELAGVKVARGTPEQARERRVREFIAFDDPFGNRLELAVGQVQLARPVTWGRPAGITEFGHLCVDVADVREAHAF